MKPFWEYPTYSRPVDIGLHWMTSHLADRALQTKETIENYFATGSLKPLIKIQDFITDIKELGGHVFRHIMPSKHENEQWIIIWEMAAVEIEYFQKNRGVTFTMRSNDYELALKLKAVADKLVTKVVTRGKVFVVTSGNSGPRLTEMGVAGEDFISENYRPEVIEEYTHAVMDLNSSHPCGSIVLLSGPPGSGKTHLIRAVLNEVPKGTFILVPSNMIAALGSPEFLSLLLREQRKDHPLILIVEDADEAIVNRKEANTSAISAVLNFSNGIYGDLLNIRIICTTNIKIDSLDEAVKRDGRLCRHIEIGLLDNAQANKVYERLAGKPGKLKDKFYSLATIYVLARDNGQGKAKTKQQEKALVGFQVPSRAEAMKGMEEAFPEQKLHLNKWKDVKDKLGIPSSEKLPAEDLDLGPGEETTTDEGDRIRADETGQLHMVEDSEDASKPGEALEQIKQLIEDLESGNYPDQTEGFDTVSYLEGIARPDGQNIPIYGTKNGQMTVVGKIESDGNIVIDDDADLIDEDPDDDDEDWITEDPGDEHQELDDETTPDLPTDDEE